MLFATANYIIRCYTESGGQEVLQTMAMAHSKAVENDREAVSQEEGEKEAIEGGLGDLTLGGERERKLVLKMDLHLIPLIMLLYTFSFLDRYVSAWESTCTPH